MSFKTKVDYGGNNRQLKQVQFSETTLSGKTTFGVDDVYIPENITGDTINIDALQNIQTRGLIFPNPLSAITATTTTILARNPTNGMVGELYISGLTTDLSGYLPLSGGTISSGIGLTVESIPDIDVETFSEDFESASLSAFTNNGGHAPWVISTSAATGTYSMESGNITTVEESHISLLKTLSGETNYLSFKYKTSTELGCECDVLSLFINGAKYTTWFGETPWTDYKVYLPSGDYEFKWVYAKDGGTDGGEDKVWIDDISMGSINIVTEFKGRTYYTGELYFYNDVYMSGKIYDAKFANDLVIFSDSDTPMIVGRGGNGIGRNTAMGNRALINNTSGFNNTAIGHGVLDNNTSGTWNTAMGRRTFEKITTQSDNTGIGSYCATEIEGSCNTFVGSQACQSAIQGEKLTAIGYQAGRNVSTASTFLDTGVTYLGAQSDKTGDVDVSNSTALGYGSRINKTNQITLGNSSVTEVISSGIFISDVTINDISSATGTTLVTKDYLEDSTINKQKEITGDYTVLSGDNNYTIFLITTTGTTITVNDDLPDNFECSFYNDATGTVSFTGGTATLYVPDGSNLEQDKVCTVIKRGNLNNYKLKGELK